MVKNGLKKHTNEHTTICTGWVSGVCGAPMMTITSLVNSHLSPRTCTSRRKIPRHKVLFIVAAPYTCGQNGKAVGESARATRLEPLRSSTYHVRVSTVGLRFDTSFTAADPEPRNGHEEVSKPVQTVGVGPPGRR